MTQNQSSRWDLGRFFQTLAYFEVLPFFGCLKRLWKGQTQHSEGGQGMATHHSRVVLVVGATSELGQQIVQRLVAQGYQVRSLVSHLESAQAQAGAAVDLIVANPAEPQALNPASLGCLDAVVWVKPLTDLSNFTVETLLPAIAPVLSASGEKIIFDFCRPSTQLSAIWGAVDDVVMGGVSQSEIRLTDTGALFTGSVSTANSGGFASVRTRNLDPAIPLADYEGVQLRVKGDGNRYKFLLRTEAKWDGTAYSYAFDTQPDTWLDIQIPFSQLTPVFRAKTLPDAPPIDRDRICSWQLMLSKFEYDGALNPHFTPGFFQLQVAAIKAYGGPQLPQWLLVQDDTIQVMQVQTFGGAPRLESLTSDRLLASLSPAETAERCVQLLGRSLG